MYEIELGTPIGDVLMLAGGPAERPRAVLVGGYFGGWMPAARLADPTVPADPAAAGGAMGAGILIVLPGPRAAWPRRPGWSAISRRRPPASAGPASSACPPWPTRWPTWGTTVAAAGRWTRSGLLPVIEGRGACRHPDGATQLVRSALRAFAEDARRHDLSGACPAAPGAAAAGPGDDERDWDWK